MLSEKKYTDLTLFDSFEVEEINKKHACAVYTYCTFMILNLIAILLLAVGVYQNFNVYVLLYVIANAPGVWSTNGYVYMPTFGFTRSIVNKIIFIWFFLLSIAAFIVIIALYFKDTIPYIDTSDAGRFALSILFIVGGVIIYAVPVLHCVFTIVIYKKRWELARQMNKGELLKDPEIEQGNLFISDM